MDHMGSDEDIVQAARTSYQKGTKKVSDDRTLLRYLMRRRYAPDLRRAPVGRDTDGRLERSLGPLLGAPEEY
jgi:hypothetical protein